MAVTIEGWIEFSPFNEIKEDYSWIGWMKINPIIQFNDEINWILMGNPKEFTIENPKHVPIAKERGFPKNPSNCLKKEIFEITEFKKKNPEEMIYGFTNINYSEIINIKWEEKYNITAKGNWFDLFELINYFIKIKYLKPEQIRITLWYEW